MIAVWLACWMIVFSALTFAAFAVDKARAVLGRTRIPESFLHLLELCGGWPGAILAMWTIRHKNRKPRYIAATAAIIGLWLAAITVAAWIGRS